MPSNHIPGSCKDSRRNRLVGRVLRASDECCSCQSRSLKAATSKQLPIYALHPIRSGRLAEESWPARATIYSVLCSSLRSGSSTGGHARFQPKSRMLAASTIRTHRNRSPSSAKNGKATIVTIRWNISKGSRSRLKDHA